MNCISTEFTPKKHGGEKGVPFRIQVETRLPGGPRLHAASCQVKVFKLKGADRKHKQDRDKILRRPAHEQDKYQPSYDCTVLSDVSDHSTLFSPQNYWPVWLLRLITDSPRFFIAIQFDHAKWRESLRFYRGNVSTRINLAFISFLWWKKGSNYSQITYVWNI